MFGMGPDLILSTLLVVLIRIRVPIPCSLMVVLRQRYLAFRVALSSGITLGLTVSAGGMIVPLFERPADGYGLDSSSGLLWGAPILAFHLTFGLPFPQIDRKSPV